MEASAQPDPRRNAWLQIELPPVVIDQIVAEAVRRVLDRIDERAAASGRWLDSRAAAAYLGMSVAALHKHTAARTIPFEQEAPNGKCWFDREALDAWRRGGLRCDGR